MVNVGATWFPCWANMVSMLQSWNPVLATCRTSKNHNDPGMLVRMGCVVVLLSHRQHVITSTFRPLLWTLVSQSRLGPGSDGIPQTHPLRDGRCNVSRCRDAARVIVRSGGGWPAYPLFGAGTAFGLGRDRPQHTIPRRWKRDWASSRRGTAVSTAPSKGSGGRVE